MFRSHVELQIKDKCKGCRVTTLSSQHSGNVESVQHEDVVVVLGQGHHVSLAGYLQPATSGDLHGESLSILCQVLINIRTFTWGHSNSPRRVPSLEKTTTWNLLPWESPIKISPASERKISEKEKILFHAPDMSIPFGKFVIFSHPILLRNCPSSVKTTTLWPYNTTLTLLVRSSAVSTLKSQT